MWKFSVYFLSCCCWCFASSSDKNVTTIATQNERVLVIAPALLLRRFIHSGDERVLTWFVPPAVSEMRIVARAHRNVSIHSKACAERTISVYLKYGSYTVLNPGNFDLPKSFLNASDRASVHSLHLETSQQNKTLFVENPRPGIWYASSFIDWMDPRQLPIQQSGITAVCYTFLYTEVAVNLEHPVVIQNEKLFNVDLSNKTLTYFQYYSVEDVPKATLFFDIFCVECENISVSVQLNKLPGKVNNSLDCIIESIKTGNSYNVTFLTQPDSLYYIKIFILNETSTLNQCSIDNSKENTFTKYITLVKELSTDRFEYEMNLPKDNASWSELINVSDNVTVLRWHLRGPVDIGGSLTIAVSLKADLKYFMGFIRSTSKDGKEYKFEANETLTQVVICLREGDVGWPLSNGSCQYTTGLAPALMILSNVDSTTISEYIHVPYPEEGIWYMSVRAFGSNLTDQINDGEYSIPVNISIPFNNMPPANMSIVMSVSSSPCLASTCGRFGDCEYFESGGIIFSGCVCRLNYGGWACNDGRSAISTREVLTGTLLLTLSNILFLLPAYVAYKRLFKIEACIYVLTCLASTAYHACDAPDRAFAVCMFDARVLQFADFYSGLLSLWITLILMASLSEVNTNYMHVCGAIFIALITAWNKHSLIAFMLPLSVGFLIVVGSWGLKMYYSRRLFPSHSYYKYQLPIGVFIATVGLICYAFLQTEDNYKIVHAFWHMIIALSLVCLIPNPKTFYPQTENS